MKEENYKQELSDLFNRNGVDSVCNIPDYILADFAYDVIAAIGNANNRLIMHQSGSGLEFTPGVPTEDGWYVVKWGYVGPQEILGLADDPDMQVYGTVNMRGGDMLYDNDTVTNYYTILSHAKLPEL